MRVRNGLPAEKDNYPFTEPRMGMVERYMLYTPPAAWMIITVIIAVLYGALAVVVIPGR